MKHPLLKALIVGILVIGASAPMFAQTYSPWLEQWYRAKFGRPLPAETAQLNPAPNAELAASAATTDTASAPANTWFGNWYRDKFGRPSPLAEASAQTSWKSARRFAANKEKRQSPVNTWFEQWYRDKFGHPSPQEESRLNPLGH